MISGYCKCGNIVSSYEIKHFKKCSKCYEDELTMIKLKEAEHLEEIGKEKELKKQRQICSQRAALVNKLTKLIGKTISDVKVKGFINTDVSEQIQVIEVEFSDGSKATIAEEKEYWAEKLTSYLEVEIVIKIKD